MLHISLFDKLLGFNFGRRGITNLLLHNFSSYLISDIMRLNSMKFWCKKLIIPGGSNYDKLIHTVFLTKDF